MLWWMLGKRVSLHPPLPPYPMPREQAAELSASDVILSTGHGPMRIKRLVGQRVRMQTHEAPVDVRALYGEKLDINSGEARGSRALNPQPVLQTTQSVPPTQYCMMDTSHVRMINDFCSE